MRNMGDAIWNDPSMLIRIFNTLDGLTSLRDQPKNRHRHFEEIWGVEKWIHNRFQTDKLEESLGLFLAKTTHPLIQIASNAGLKSRKCSKAFILGLERGDSNQIQFYIDKYRIIVRFQIWYILFNYNIIFFSGFQYVPATFKFVFVSVSLLFLLSFNWYSVVVVVFISLFRKDSMPIWFLCLITN